MGKPRTTSPVSQITDERGKLYLNLESEAGLWITGTTFVYDRGICLVKLVDQVTGEDGGYVTVIVYTNDEALAYALATLEDGNYKPFILANIEPVNLS